MRLLAARDRALWQRLARTVPGGSAAHEWDFLDLQEHLLGIRVERYVLVDGGEVVGLLPVARRSRWALHGAWLPFPSLGPVARPEVLAVAMDACRHHQRVHGPVVANFDLAPDLFEATRAFADSEHVRVQHDETVLVDTSHGSDQQVIARMERSRRQQLRRAQGAGIHVEPSRPGEVGGILDRVLDEAYAARGARSPYPAGSGSRIEAWAAGRHDVHLASVFLHETLIGASVVLAGHPTALGWLSGTLREHRDANPGTVMVQDVLAWSAVHGHEAVDLAGRVDPAVLRFKKSFGGRVVPAARLEVYAGPTSARRALRALRSRNTARPSPA